MRDRMGDMMSRSRRGSVVGREREVAEFASLLSSSRDRGGFVLHVYGPGGIGKTTLLSLFMDVAREIAFEPLSVNARDVEPSPSGLVEALCTSADVADFDALDRHLLDRPTVIFIDSYGTLRALDGWVRDQFLPLLPKHTSLVLADRRSPATEWIASPDLVGIQRTMQLRNIDRNAAREVLRRRGVPDAEHPAVLEFTHGHPLALSLVADLYRERPQSRFLPAHQPAIVHRLVESLVDTVTQPEHRRAIEVAAIVRVVDEPLLTSVVPDNDGSELFAWLSELSFMEPHPRGLAPHDLAREAIALDLKWRNPQRFVQLHNEARSHYRRRLDEMPHEHATTLMDYVYLHRESPFVRPYMDFSGEGAPHADALHPEEHETLARIVRQHEGDDAARIVQAWLNHDPTLFTVIRSTSSTISGFLLSLPLHEIELNAAAFDPLTERVLRSVASSLRLDEAALLFRFWMDSERHQAITPVQSRIFIEMVHRYLSTPRLVVSYIVCTDPEVWQPLFEYADMPRQPELEEADTGIFGHDWRARPPVAWLDLLAEREVAAEPALITDQPVAELVVLSESEFRMAVADALRNFSRVEALSASPLLRSSLVVRSAHVGSPVDRLRTLVNDAANRIRDDSKLAKLYPALHHAFLNPAPTHEAAARLAHVSYSTFRRHVEAGKRIVADRLWEVETEGA